MFQRIDRATDLKGTKAITVKSTGRYKVLYRDGSMSDETPMLILKRKNLKKCLFSVVYVYAQEEGQMDENGNYCGSKCLVKTFRGFITTPVFNCNLFRASKKEK